MGSQTSGARIRFVPPLRQAFSMLGWDTKTQKRIFKWSLLSVSGFSLAQIQRAFKYTQAQPGGSAWQGVSQGWAEKKTEEGKSAFIGTYSGDLSGSFSGGTDPRVVRSSEAVSANMFRYIAEIGTTIPYGGYFNEGTKFMPAREFIPTSSLVTSYWRTLHARLLENPKLVPDVG